MISRLALIFILSLGFVPNFAFSAKSVSCQISVKNAPLLSRVLKGEKVSGFHLLVEFENIHNRPEYSRPVMQVEVPLVKIKASEVEVSYFGNYQKAQSLISGNSSIQLNWYQHPFNTSSVVPYYYKNSTSGLVGFLSASRSIFYEKDGDYFSIRTPTDHPRGPEGETVLAKTEIDSELDSAMTHMRTITELDSIFGGDKGFDMALELAIVKTKPDKKIQRPRSGYMIRSLNFLKKPDHYYMPAFSLQTIGSAIAKKHNKTFHEFWKKHYAEALGRTKAQLLLRYGLQMDFPHGQNILIELDSTLKPTGRLVLRDIDDMSANDSVVEVLNRLMERKKKQKFTHRSSKAATDLEYMWDRFSHRVISWSKDPKVFSEKIDQDWLKAYLNAYIKEIAAALKVSPKDIGKTSNEIDSMLRSEWGQDRLLEYYEGLSL
jgi:hypothetical protein